ncbi:MAG: hypothetical protein GWN29_11840, partial [Gammaproteobacteria bacterium]|nr:hypothetical protein [Gammaproteobacteria bacterium]
TLAVLPFDSLSAGLDNANLAIAIRNDLLANLTKISALRVISRPSNSVYQNDQQNSTEIGNDLDSTVILEGSVQRSGNTVRINVQLIDANTAEHLWAEIYQRELTVENVFGLQSEMAASIASALEATLLPDELDRLNVVPTLNARAYEFYLTGIDYLSRLDHRQFTPLAVQQLQRAVAEDSAFAQAWAELARARLRLVFFDLGEDEAQLPLAQQAVEQALTLAPDAGEPYLALAWYHYMGEQDFSAALEALAVAEERLPGSAEVLLTKAYVHRREGNWEQELANIEQAMDLDPQNFSLVHESFSVNGRLRNYEKAQADLERLLEFAPDNARYRQVEAMFSMQRDGDFAALKAAAASLEPLADRAFLGWQAALYERDYELAIRYLDVWKFEAPELEGRPWERQSMYGIAYTLAGRPDLGTAEFLNARAQIEDALNAASDDAELHVDLGEVLAWTGEREAAERLALRAIDLAQSGDALHARRVQGNAIIRVLGPAGARASTVEMLDEHLQQGPWSIEGLLPDPRLDPVRDDAGFRALVSRHRRQ